MDITKQGAIKYFWICIWMSTSTLKTLVFLSVLNNLPELIFLKQRHFLFSWGIGQCITVIISLSTATGCTTINEVRSRNVLVDVISHGHTKSGTRMYIFYINLLSKDSLTSYVIRYQSILMPIWPNMCNRIGWSQPNVYISWLYGCLYSTKWSGPNLYLPKYWIALENVPLLKNIDLCKR